MLDFNEILKEVETHIKEESTKGNPEKLLKWIVVLEKMKDCGMIHFNRHDTIYNKLDNLN